MRTLAVFVRPAKPTPGFAVFGLRNGGDQHVLVRLVSSQRTALEAVRALPTGDVFNYGKFILGQRSPDGSWHDTELETDYNGNWYM